MLCPGVILRIYFRCVLVVWLFILPESLSSSGNRLIVNPEWVHHEMSEALGFLFQGEKELKPEKRGNRFRLVGSPAPPTRPDCFIPCDENCRVDIHCTWAPGPDPQTPCNYTLHWEPSYSEDRHVFCGHSLNGSIKRGHFSSHNDLRVWVQAENQHGSARSLEATFNVAEIFKPPPPKVTWSVQEPLEISWISSCDQLQHSLGSCDVRHRTEASQDWIQEGSYHGSFTFLGPEPCLVYEVQVRCVCASGLKSDWSEPHRKTSTGTAPLGELDVWMDCGTPPQTSDCVLTWKKLPPSQACGPILGYEVRLAHLNSSQHSVNISITQHSGRLVCEELKCHLNSSLKNVSSVSVLAYNAHGASVPSSLSMPVPDEGEDKKGFNLTMTEENLTVLWNFPTVFSETLKEYVVQYKQPGSPLGQGLDWVRVCNRHTSASLKGHFKRYTPYQVSLLAVSHSNLSSSPSPVQHLSSVIGFSLQGTPSRVPSFKVLSIDASYVTMCWEPVPLLQQNGIILYYQMGINRQNVYNVSSSSTSQQLSVQPGQKYEVWIRAVTKAGPGENSTVTFRTNTQQKEIVNNGLVLSLLPFLFLGVVALALVCACPGAKTTCPLMHQCYEKVPDPGNSLIFKQENQIHEFTEWFTLYESQPKISLLEVVEIKSWAFKSTMKETSGPEGPTRSADRDRFSQMDCTDEDREETVTGDSQRTNSKYRAEAYSKIIDSEEEGEEAEDFWHSSKEELVESGYEKHFMPTAEEIQCDV